MTFSSLTSVLSLFLICILLLSWNHESVALNVLTKESYITKVNSFLAKSQFTKDNLKEWHDGLLTLFKLDRSVSENYSNVCFQLDKLETSSAAVSETYYAVVVHMVLKCSESSALNDKIQKSVSLFLENSRTEMNDKQVNADSLIKMERLEAYHHFARLLLLKKNLLKSTIQKQSLFLKKIFKKWVEIDSQISFEMMTHKVECITALAKVLGGANDEKIFDALYSVSRIVGDFSKNINSKTPLHEVSLFAKAAYKLASLSKVITKLPIDAHATIAKILSEQSVAGTMNDKDYLTQVYNHVEAIKSLEESPFELPVILGEISVENNKIIIDAKLVNGEIPNNLLLRSVKLSGSKKDLVQNVKMNQEGSHLVYDFSKIDRARKELNAKLGHFIFEFDFKGQITRRYLTYSTNQKIRSFEVRLSDRDQRNSNRQKIQYPNIASFTTMDASNQVLEISIEVVDSKKGESLNPEQVFVHVYPVQALPGHEVSFAHAKSKTIRMSKSSSGAFNLKIDFSKDFRAIDAEYAIELFVADSYISNPIQWKFAQMVIRFEGTFEPSLEDQRWAIRKEIIHQFPPHEKRSHGILTHVFTMIVIIPLIVFIVASLKVTGTTLFTQCPTNPLSFAANIVLQLCIIAMIGVLSMYFYSWKIMRVLKALGALAVIATLIGNIALRGVYNKRTLNH